MQINHTQEQQKYYCFCAFVIQTLVHIFCALIKCVQVFVITNYTTVLFQDQSAVAAQCYPTFRIR